MREGRRQLDTFLQKQHEGARSFEQVVERDSKLWEEHLRTAQCNDDVVVRTRHVLSLLPGLDNVYDIKVGLPGRPDDAVYLKSSYARQWLPRGNCIAEWKRQNMTYFFPLVRGYRKFTGQEDDGELKKRTEDAQAEMLKFFTKPRAQTEWVISTVKENGEAGHLAVLKRSNGEFIYVLGSKNTHLLAQKTEDIDRARMQGRSNNKNDPFLAAAPIATAILRKLFALKPADRSLLCEFLWQTRATASFEVLCPSHQHVQLPKNLREDTSVFYGLSLMTLNHAEGAEICVNPVLLYEFFGALGIQTVSYTVERFDAGAFDIMLERSKRAYNIEGCVSLFLDNKAAVIGMEKHKSIWYVCLRAIREKAKAFCRAVKLAVTSSCQEEKLEAAKKSTQKRLQAISKYMRISDDISNRYENLGTLFLEYLLKKEIVCDPTVHEDQSIEARRKQVAREVADLFPIVWNRFLDHTGLNDDIGLQGKNG
uniref:DUF7920 domain-containing protein n=1 Tax=Peronospora matthiolae TaxID=2874970 RepID=A0AAV1U117_9STRA